MQLIVLGMHRSGTSVLARILNLMGVYLGPEGMSTGANPENPKGFWERRDVRLLNDAVLHSVGCDWDRVADLDLAKIPAEMNQAFDDVARRILLEMDAHRPWFIKEPRLCILLELWRRHLEVPVVVNIHRDPVEVAASLHRRSGMPMEAGLELWEYYTRSAASASRGLPAVTVQHAELMGAPDAVASRLHDELVRLGVPGIRRATARELAGFIDRSLHRERSGRSSLDAYSDSRQARMYRDLMAGGTIVPLDSAVTDDWQAMQKYERGLPPVRPPDLRKVRSSGYDAFMLDERLKSSVKRMGRMESAITARLEERLDRFADEIRGDGRADRAGQRDPLPEEAVAAHDRLEQELEQRYAELAVAARELDAARTDAAARAAEAKRQLGDLAGKKAAVESRLREVEQQQRQAREKAAALRSQLDGFEGKLRWLRAERKELSGSLERERAQRAALQAELDKLTGSRSWRMTAPLRALARGLRR